MAHPLESLVARAGEWVNIYQESGITVGTKIAVQNIGSSDLQLSSSVTKPANDDNLWQKIQPNDLPMSNTQGDQGAWVFSPNQIGKLNVWIVP